MYIRDDSSLVKTKSFYETGELKGESFVNKDTRILNYKEYFKNGQLSFEGKFADEKQIGEEKKYHENGVLKSKIDYIDDKQQNDAIYYDDNSKFNYYLLFDDETGNPIYKLDIDSLGKIKEEGYKLYYWGANTVEKNGKQFLALGDSLNIALRMANPPSCNKVFYLKLNGIIIDSLKPNGLMYKKTIFPKKKGANKLQAYIYYFCKDYDLQPNYFELDFIIE